MVRAIDKLEPFQRAISKAHLAAAGVAVDSLENPDKPLIAIANSWNEVCPGHEPLKKLAEEVMSPIRTAITRARGPLFQFLTEGSLQNTTGSRANRVKLASTKKGIENFLTGSLIEIRPMSINKLQGLRCKIATVDEWLSGDIRGMSPVRLFLLDWERSPQ